MMAAMNNRTEVLKQLVKMDNCPLDFKQMKVGEEWGSSDIPNTSAVQWNISQRCHAHMYTKCKMTLS